MKRSPGVIIIAILAVGLAMTVLLAAPLREGFTFRQSLVLAFGLVFLAPPLTVLLVFRRPRQAFVSLVACFAAYIFCLGMLTLSYSPSVTVLATCVVVATAVAAETLLLKARPSGAVVNLIVGAGFVFLLGGMLTEHYTWVNGGIGAVTLWVIAAAVALILNAGEETRATRKVNPLDPGSLPR